MCRKTNAVSPATDDRRSRRTNSLRSSRRRPSSTSSRGRPLTAVKRPDPEDFPDNRRALQERLLLRCQRVEARGDDSLDGLGQRELLPGERLGEHADVFLGVERVAARVGDEPRRAAVLDGLLREERGLAAARSPRPRAARARRSRRSACRRPSPDGARGAPAGTCTRPGSGRRTTSRRGGRRSRAGRRRPSAGPRRRARAGTARPATRRTGARPRRPRGGGRPRPGRPAEPDQRPEVLQDPPGLYLVIDDRGHGGAELLGGGVGCVRLEDARLCLHHLAERPEADALPVGERASLAPVANRGRVLVERRPELEEQPALPDPSEPTSVTSCGDRSRSARETASRRSLSSSVRPTSSAPPLKAMSTPSRVRGATTSQTGTGSDLPFACTGSASRYSITAEVAR